MTEQSDPVIVAVDELRVKLDAFYADAPRRERAKRWAKRGKVATEMVSLFGVFAFGVCHLAEAIHLLT